MKRITRICYNSLNWRRPTGEAKTLETPDSFNGQFGYGHEEWLFRTEWQINGWQYGFIQGVNKSRRPLIKTNKPIDLTLFTITPTGQRNYVATIQDLECLNHSQSEDALLLFKDKGWFDLMKSEISAVEGKLEVLADPNWVTDMVNVRFRPENAIWFKPNTFAQLGDPILKLNRYQLYKVKEGMVDTNKAFEKSREGRDTALSQTPYFRTPSMGGECTPEHARLQHNLLQELKKELPNHKIRCENNFVDITATCDSEHILYEIKSDLRPKTVLRLAIGQLLEYGYHTSSQKVAPTKLVAVGRAPLDADDERYLQLLRSQFLIPIEYRVTHLN